MPDCVGWLGEREKSPDLTNCDCAALPHAGEDVTQHGVINIPVAPLGLCAGITRTAKYNKCGPMATILWCDRLTTLACQKRRDHSLMQTERTCA